MQTTTGDWNGYRRLDFAVDGRESYVVCPAQPAAGNPWVWRTEFFGAFDTVDRALLARGWHLAYHSMSELYGNDTAMGYMEAFWHAAHDELGLSARPVPFGFSRGGSYAVNYAHFHPEHVGALYLDAPLLNFCAVGDEVVAELFDRMLECYGLTAEQMRTFDRMPVAYAASIADSGISVALCAGLSDDVVFYPQNGAAFAERFRAAGGRLLLIEKPGVGHHPHSVDDPERVAQIADFLEETRLK